MTATPKPITPLRLDRTLALRVRVQEIAQRVQWISETSARAQRALQLQIREIVTVLDRLDGRPLPRRRRR